MLSDVPSQRLSTQRLPWRRMGRGLRRPGASHARCGHSPKTYHIRDGVAVSYQDRHHLQQEAASGAGLADLPASSPPPQTPTKAPYPPGTGRHLPRTGSGSGSSWRQYRRKYLGSRVCRRPESVLEKGRQSVAPREGDPPEKRGRGAHSAGGQTPLRRSPAHS